MKIPHAKLIAVLCGALIAFAACAGFTPVKRHEVCGTVMGYDGRPVQSARVKLEGPLVNRDASTNQYGWFSIDRARLNGRCSLMVQANGFTAMEIIELGLPRETRVRFNMRLYPQKPDLNAAGHGVGAISGKINDEKGSPIPGVSVILPGTPFGAAATFDGLYRISGIPAGKYLVSAQTVGYAKVRYGPVPVMPDSVTAVDFVLYPIALVLPPIELGGRPLFDRFVTSNEWSRDEERLESEPLKKTADIIDICPGMVRR